MPSLQLEDLRSPLGNSTSWWWLSMASEDVLGRLYMGLCMECSGDVVQSIASKHHLVATRRNFFPSRSRPPPRSPSHWFHYQCTLFIYLFSMWHYLWNLVSMRVYGYWGPTLLSLNQEWSWLWSWLSKKTKFENQNWKLSASKTVFSSEDQAALPQSICLF